MRKPATRPDADFMALADRYEEANAKAHAIWAAKDEELLARRKRMLALDAKGEAQERVAKRLFQQLLATPATTYEALVYKLKLGKEFDGIGSVTGDNGGLKQYSNGWGTDALVSAMEDAERAHSVKRRG
jgi:hypothetical protein